MTRAEKAKKYFLEGYNCSQSVALAFADLIDLEPEQIAKIVSGYGGGMGRMREVCGSISGAVFVLSNLYGYSNAKAFDEKKSLYADVQAICKEFEKINGSIVCRKLLGINTDGASAPTPDKRTKEYYKKRPCAELIACSAEILDNYIKNKE